MRRNLTHVIAVMGSVALAVMSVSCGADKTLGPVQTIDGRWEGTQNGYSLSLNLAQSGTDVSGSAALAGIQLATTGTVSGTFVYPDVHLTLTIPGFFPVDYVGTMSTTEARIIGKLNGSGLSDVAIDVRKK